MRLQDHSAALHDDRNGPLSACRGWLVPLVGWTCIVLLGCGGSSGSSGETSLRDQVKSAQREANPSRRARRLIRVALLQHQAQDTSGSARTIGLASAACDEISNDADRARMLTLLAKAQSRHGDRGVNDALDRASQAIAAIENAESRLLAQSAWAEAVAAAGNVTGAVDALAVVETDAATLDDVASRIRVLCRTAESYDDARVARPDAADRLIVEALVLAREIADPRDRCRALTEISQTQSRLRRASADNTLQLALDMARRIESPWSRAHALHEVAVAISDRARSLEILQEAETTAEQVPEPDLRKQTLELIWQSIGQKNRGGG